MLSSKTQEEYCSTNESLDDLTEGRLYRPAPVMHGRSRRRITGDFIRKRFAAVFPICFSQNIVRESKNTYKSGEYSRNLHYSKWNIEQHHIESG